MAARWTKDLDRPSEVNPYVIGTERNGWVAPRSWPRDLELLDALYHAFLCVLLFHKSHGKGTVNHRSQTNHDHQFEKKKKRRGHCSGDMLRLE